MNGIKNLVKRTSQNWRGYLLAIVLVALATWLKYLAQPDIIPANVPILYILAIVPTAIFFGFGPSILVCILSVLAYDYFFIPPLYQINLSNIQNAPITVIFLLVGVLFSFLASNLRRKNREALMEITARKQSEAELEKYRDHLEELVKQRTTELEKANLDLKQDILERQKAEEALQQSEQRWATTLASVGDAVIATDTAGRITFMNKVAEALTGWSLSEAFAKPIAEVFDIINESTHQKVDSPVSKVLQNGMIAGLANHTILRRKDGTTVAIDDSGAPIKTQDGKTTGVVLIFRDITERKQIEVALSYERDKLSNILNSMEDGVYIVNRNYDIEYINPALESIFGPVEGQKCYRYFHNLPQVCPWCKNLEIFEGKHVHWELHFAKPNRVYDMIGTPLRNPDGRILVQEILHDITESKQAEEKLRQSEEKLKRSQEIAHLGSWELDLLSNTLSWSDEVYRIFRLKPQEFGATYEAFLEAVHPEDREAVDAAYSGSLREGRDSYEIEHRVIRKSTGEIRYVHEKCQHVRNESGKIIRSVGMVHDITERLQSEKAIKEINRQLNLRAAELETANKELEAFSYSVSHDLRAPLRSIDGFSQAVLEDYASRLDDQGKDYLNRIRTSSQLMARLIDDMLGLSRVVRAELQLKKVNLSDMARAIAEELKRTEPERQVRFNIMDGIEAIGDANLLHSVMVNLLSNAFKFTVGCQDARINFGVTEKNGEKVYYVIDNGAGFDMKYAYKLFKPFQRLHSTSEFPGTGIGLATVYRIVQRHGGKVWAEGQIGNGATFYFSLDQERKSDGK
jgi:PAS domain S-box-containing protein